VQRLENGNTLICEGRGGRFFEIDDNENIVWEYINPVNNMGAVTQNTIIEDNNVFRCTRYAADYAGFEGQTLEPQGYIENGSTFECNLFTSISDKTENLDLKLLINPNPAKEYFNIQLEGELSENDFNSIKIYNLNAELVFHSEKFEELIYIGDIPKGIYFIQFDFGKELLTEKLIVQ